MKKGDIDIIIPAYKAHKTINKTLASIAMQRVVDKCHVIIVNDACPEGSYQTQISTFSKLLNIKEIKLEENGGPGVARQKGIEAGDSEFFTCIDADDTFANTLSLEALLAGINTGDFVKCCSGTFIQLGEKPEEQLPHQADMVWMFGKLYRRKFIEDYGIKFNDTRANEDTGYNKWIQMLCNNEREQIRFIQDIVYYWHYKEDSITRINDGQYGLDQCFCGWTDNMIYAIENVKKKRPFDGSAMQTTAAVMFQLYYYWIETVVKKPVFAEQNWEYVKKFYHKCYKKIEEDISDDAFAELYSMISMQKWSDGSMMKIMPSIGIKEFFEKLHEDEYDPDHIYDIWDKMKEDPKTLELIKNNEQCGVCKEGYTNKPFN